MHRAWSAAVLVSLCSPALAALATTGASDPVAEARDLLSKGDPRAAIAVLEGGMLAEPSRKPEILGALRDAYGAALREAEAAGRPRDAALFRDNLEILNRKVRPVANPPAASPPRTAAIPVRPASDAPLPRLEAAPRSELERPLAVDRDAEAVTLPPVTDAEVKDKAAATPNRVAPTPDPLAARTPTDGLRDAITAADASFVAKKYDEAGRIYGTLHQKGELPKSRREHWAYCRWTAIVRRINARPSTPAEWQAIDAEIKETDALSPNHWYGEYLRNRAAERTPGRRASRSNKVVVRGAAPEEPAAARPSPIRPSPMEVPAAPEATARAGQWQVRETANFRLFHDDPGLADRVATVAEAARESQLKRWAGAAAPEPWTPRCDIYLYPTAKLFSQMTNQPEESPGFSTMGMNSGKIVNRRINLRGDHPKLLSAVLPHEITHVVLADLFPHQQIPRWADEGMAVLAEPTGEQRLRAADLEKPLASGRLFKLDDLLVMDYPEGKFWGLYYAQSVSLTRFLVEQGTPAQFIQFVQGSQRRGPEAELRRLYRIDGFDDLQRRWLDYARAKTDAPSTLADNSAAREETTSR